MSLNSITKDFFMNEITKLALLTGQRIQKTTADLFYHELKDSHYQDFSKAMNNMKYSDKRITLGTLHNAISVQMSERLEKESVIQAMKDKSVSEQFWKENKQYIDQGHCNRKCISCPVKYCQVIHDHSIQAMKDILDNIITLPQAHFELNEKFEGWNVGFVKEPF